MRAKKLGRHELLAWINTTTQSDYPKIENLSDGVAFCQVLDYYFPHNTEMNKLKSKFLTL
jgi:RP/EB family microtubule-associated protein